MRHPSNRLIIPSALLLISSAVLILHAESAEAENPSSFAVPERVLSEPATEYSDHVGEHPQSGTPQPSPNHADVHYGPHARNVLDYWQAHSAQPTPLLVSIYGGEFLEVNKRVEPWLLKECLATGISVAVITYRFSSEAIAPASFRDGARGIGEHQ